MDFEAARRILRWSCAIAIAGCASSTGPGDAPGPRSKAAVVDAASASSSVPDAASVDAAASALPAVAPDKPSYHVPVADPALEPFATFEVSNVSFEVNGSSAALEYPFPAALSGVSDQSISLHGPLTTPGVAELSGAAGTARCEFSTTVVRCNEMLTALKTDPAAAQDALKSRPLLEQNLRGQVIQLFSSDPIGVLTFAASNEGRNDD